MRRLAALLILLFAAAPAPPEPTEKEPAKETITIAGERFELELAVDEAARTKGLGGREKLDEHGGMLFVFPDARYRSFWMKDCLIDIDLLYLDGRGQVIRVHRMKKEPPRGPGETQWEYERRLRRYPSLGRMRIAIELKTGTIDRLELKRGRVIEMDYERLKKLAQ